MTCKICNIINNEETLKIVKVYQDDAAIAVLSKKPASLCHVIIFPRNHYTIIEQVPDNEIAHLFTIANKISKAMFESLNIQGTNIFVQNGVSAGQDDPHFSIHIIARTENDNVNLSWEPKTLNQEEMSTIELSYKNFTEGTVFSKEETNSVDKPKIGEAKEGSEEMSDNDDDENYMIKYFNRIP